MPKNDCVRASRRFVSVAVSVASVLAIPTFAVLTTGCGVPNVPPGAPAQVHVVATNPGDHFHVQMKDAAGKQADCEAPCTLQPSSGTAEMKVTGASKFEKKIVVPEGTSDASIKPIKKSTMTVAYALLGVSIGVGLYTSIFLKDFVPVITGASISGACAIAALPFIIMSGDNEVNLTASAPSSSPSPSPSPSPTPTPTTTDPNAPPSSSPPTPESTEPKPQARVRLVPKLQVRGPGLAATWTF